MFQTDCVAWGVSIYWLVCGVYVKEMVGYFNGLEGLVCFIGMDCFGWSIRLRSFMG